MGADLSLGVVKKLSPTCTLNSRLQSAHWSHSASPRLSWTLDHPALRWWLSYTLAPYSWPFLPPLCYSCHWVPGATQALQGMGTVEHYTCSLKSVSCQGSVPLWTRGLGWLQQGAAAADPLAWSL